MEENRTLKAQNTLLYNKNSILQNNLQATTEENIRLKTELQQLRDSLSVLAQYPMVAGDNTSARMEAMIPSGRSEQQTSSGVTASSHENSGNSPSQGST